MVRLIANNQTKRWVGASCCNDKLHATKPEVILKSLGEGGGGGGEEAV